jgi:hypothetical protein
LGLDNPEIRCRSTIELIKVSAAFLLVEMNIKIGKLIWQDVGVGYDGEIFSSEEFLHLYHVEAETVLSRQLKGLREMIDLLVVQ